MRLWREVREERRDYGESKENIGKGMREKERD